MNILTFDIEEWALAKAGGYGTAKRYLEYDGYLNKILDALDERGFKGTFFCTGLMGTDFPDVVKLIHSRGHEVGCHSFKHTWLNKVTQEEVLEGTRISIDALEQCIGEKVLSYRAPAFSIGKKNLWVFDILVECGIERDSSVFPAARDFGGFTDFGQQNLCVIRHNGIAIKEFPIPMTTILGKKVAYSGGGYFRFFPLWFVKNEINKASYSMSYFHIGDLIPESHSVMSKEAYETYFKEPGTLKARYSRYFKRNIGKNGAMSKLMKLIEQVDFINLTEADKSIDWRMAPVAVLV